MAAVYRAVDLASGQRVALKRLSDKHTHSRAALKALFEREFLVLSQLSHPRIVAAYDYGVDAGAPYYTMELLDGADLQRLAPLSYGRVCALGRDVCSALALIHSRRMVYRDLSPQNVRCTADGQAKLIDFGALAPMGPRDDLVGTLPCVAPEVVARKPLDARTDLYAFGATLYYTLVRRHAYPAHSLPELVELWKTRPCMPSDFLPDVPRALDALIRDLLEPDPAQRPQSAAEVMERLRAIGQLDVDENLLVKSAYLSKPALVGREPTLEAFREHAARVTAQRGSTLRITGAGGAGLSRALESCELEAKLSGWLILHADANTEGTAPYAAAAALGRALLREAPRLARVHAEPHLSVLGGIIPEILEGRPDVVLEQFESPDASHRRIQPALRAWLTRVAQDRPLLVAVDDVQRVDPPSAAFVALLAREARQQQMLVVVTQPDDQTPPLQNQGALRLLARVAAPLAIDLLSPELTQSLLGSVFGEVPNLELVSRYVHQTAGGSPRDAMALAKHLVAEGAVRYEAGSWSLPSRLSTAALPPNMAEALRQRVQKLSTRARIVAYAVSREPTLAFGAADLNLLVADASPAQLAQVLKELVTEEILSCAGEQYRCVQQSWVAPLASSLSDAEKRAAHLGLAQLFVPRDDGFRHAGWLLRAGEHERALSAMAEFCEASLAKTHASPAAFHAMLQKLPEGWLETCEEALALYEQHKRPQRERFALLNRMAGFISRAGHEVVGFAHVATLLAQLAQDSGLDDLASIAADLPPAQRIQQAIGLAKERYLRTDERTRVFDPGTALKELARGMVTAMGNIATTSDYAALRSLPSLAPLVPLAPSFQLAHQLVQGLGHRLVARTEEALAVYDSLLKRVEQPDRAGLDPSHHAHIKMRVIGSMGTLEASMGRASCLRWAEQVDDAPGYDHVGALTRYLYQLWQGNPREARRFRRRFELLQLETNAYMDLQHVFSELCVHALVSDMTGVRRSVHALESVAATNLGARAGAHYGRGEYHFIRGDLSAALSEIEQALALMEPGQHMMWANAAGAHVRVLMDLERYEEARSYGERYLTSAEAERLGYVQNYIRCPLSLALSKLAQHDRARELAAASVAVCRALDISGLNAELAHETLVLVALAAGERDEAERSMPHCSAPFRMAVARRSEGTYRRRSLPTPEDASEGLSTDHDLRTAFSSCFVDCRTLAEHAEAGLDFVRRHFNAKGGVVYLRRGDQLVRVATTGEHDDDSVLRPWTLRHLQREESAQVTDMITGGDSDQVAEQEEPGMEADAPDAVKLDSYIPIPLAHYDENGFALTGIMALRGAPSTYVGEAVKLGAELSRTLGELSRKHPSTPP